MVSRGTTLLQDSYIHHCTNIGVWMDRPEHPVFCELRNCALVHCMEGIRSYDANLSIHRCVIMFVNVAIHCDHGMAIRIRDNIIHECKKMAMIVKNVRLFQLISNAIYDCSAGCDFHSIASCQLTNNCFIFIKNQLLFLTSCFVYDIDLVLTRINSYVSIIISVYQHLHRDYIILQLRHITLLTYPVIRFSIVITKRMT